MGKNDKISVMTRFSWGEGCQMILMFLEQAELPSTMTHKQLTDLRDAVDSARARLREAARA